MTPSVPVAPALALVPPAPNTRILALPDAPATVPTQPSAHPSPTYPPEPPPPNAVA